MRGARLTVLAAAGVLALAGCGASTAPGAATPSTTSAAPAASATGTEPAVDVAGAAWEHVHNLAFDGDALLLGTHQGLYRQVPGQQPELISDTPFDAMGLTYDGQQWLASGHPAPGDELPSDLGLRASPDGRTWTTLSLAGEVDFHRLAASGTTVMGIPAHGDTLLRSTDAGATWTRLDNPGVFDLAVDPVDPTRAVATTQSGPISSQDQGGSWVPLPAAPLIAFISWTPSGLLGLAPDGAVMASTDAGATWQTRGSVGGQPAALAVSADNVAALVGDRVVHSQDGGKTFSVRISGLSH
jgi:hypothetical protein